MPASAPASSPSCTRDSVERTCESFNKMLKVCKVLREYSNETPRRGMQCATEEQDVIIVSLTVLYAPSRAGRVICRDVPTMCNR